MGPSQKLEVAEATPLPTVDMVFLSVGVSPRAAGPQIVIPPRRPTLQ